MHYKRQGLLYYAVYNLLCYAPCDAMHSATCKAYFATRLAMQCTPPHARLTLQRAVRRNAQCTPPHVQALGLFQLSLVLGIGIAVPIYGNYLYRADERSRLKQAWPFALAAVAVALGAATILTAAKQGAGGRADGRARLEDEVETTPPHGGASAPISAAPESGEALSLPALAPPASRALLGGAPCRAPIEAREERL